MNKRKRTIKPYIIFMKNLFIVATTIFILSGCAHKSDSITILHTNDTHSHILPENGNRGGVAGMERTITGLRDSIGYENTLLLDCGDFSQGSLYYNVFKGAFEIDVMNILKYDAGTIGNHEFDFGMENLASLLKRAEFPIVCANYDFTDTPCEGLVKPYIILKRGGRKIGIFGLSPELEGLVLKENYKGVTFRSPIEAAQECSNALQKAGCDLIICLSHLGWQIENNYNDERLAAETNGIDIILGGHSHDYFEKPLTYKNNKGEDVIVNQTGKYTRYLGKVTAKFSK